jgi:hypothetical protein
MVFKDKMFLLPCVSSGFIRHSCPCSLGIFNWHRKWPTIISKRHHEKYRELYTCTYCTSSFMGFFTMTCSSPDIRRIQYVTEITHQPCVHMCNGLFICQLYLLPDLLEETDCKEDTPLTLPFCIIRFPPQLIIVIWIKTSVGITTVFHTGISRAVAAA